MTNVGEGDPLLALERERIAAWKRWGPAQEAAEDIELDLPAEVRNPGVLICYFKSDGCRGGGQLFSREEAAQATAIDADPVYIRNIDELRKFEDWCAGGGIFDLTPKAKAKAEAARSARERWFCREFEKAWAARDRAMEESGYLAAKAIEGELEAAADAIEVKMSQTVPVSLAGTRALAALAAERWGSSDGRDAEMLDRISEGLLRLTDSPVRTALLGLAAHACDHYDDQFTAPSMLRAIVVAIDAVTTKQAEA